MKATPPPISGRRVAGHRKRLELKQKQLADMLGIGLSTLQGIENNRHAPSLLTACDLAHILTDDNIGLLRHGGLDDEGEYHSARFWQPEHLEARPVGPVERVRPRVVSVNLQRGRNETRSSVLPLRSALRTNPGGT